jgi:hypothetical protein
LSDVAVAEDRRSLLGGVRFVGRAEIVALWKGFADIGVTDVRWTTVAERGERLALHRATLGGAAGDVEALFLQEVDDGDLGVLGISFDPDDLDGALAELDRRALVASPSTGGPANAATRAWAALIAAFRARDWDAFARKLSATATADDRRPVLGGIRYEGRDNFIALWKSFADLGVTDLPWTSLAVRGERLVLLRAVFMGVRAELEVLFVHEFDDEGLYLGGVSFDPDDLAGAHAELEARAAAATAGSSDVRDNSATRAWDRALDLVEARDWASLGAMVADDARAQDRRHLVGGEWFEGPDGIVGSWRSIVAIGVSGIHSEPIATRGDRLALFHALFEGAGSELDALLVVDADSEGIYRGGAWYDVVDVELALAELDARYLEQLPNPLAATWRAVATLADRYNARDVDGLRDLMRDDAVIVDERVTGWGQLGRESFLDHLQELVREVPDARLSCVADHALSAGGAVASFRVTGTVPGGGDFELPFCGACFVADDRIERLELLGPGAVEEGIRRLSC